MKASFLFRSMPFAAMFALTGCAHGLLNPPSLAPRAAEAIDPRVPVERALVEQPVASGMQARLAALLAQAQAGEDAFRAAIAAASRAAASAGPAQSEGWISAQQAISNAEAARVPTTRALSDIDAIAGDAVAGKGVIGANELAAVQAAAARVGAMDGAQRSALAELSARLSR